jgi:hypothetical protein
VHGGREELWLPNGGQEGGMGRERKKERERIPFKSTSPFEAG